ncbi:MAG: GFA family protein [Methylovulum sp.]
MSQEKLSCFEPLSGKRRHFCSVCGSHLVTERENLPHVIIRVATLDEDPNLIPQLPI